MKIDPDRAIWQLSVGEQQRVEILKTLQRGARVLILDEPTAVLTPQESDELMHTIRQIASEGRTVILISHKLDEVRAVADRLTVLRGGKVVAAGLAMGSMSTRELARLMVGADLPAAVNGERSPTRSSRLELDGICADSDRGLPALKSVSFTLHAGEILGVAGVAGNGQRELAQVVSGLRRPTSGTMRLDGDDVTLLGARAMARRGVAHIPEDRLGEGLVGSLPLTDNALLKSYYSSPVAAGPFLRLGEVLKFTEHLIHSFQITGAKPRSTARALSGGQLQRFLLAREMATGPKVVVAVHPTRGLDIAASLFVQEWLVKSRNDGCAILLISEDLDEVMQISDRIAVIYEGQIVAIVPAVGADREHIGLLMAGAKEAPR